MGSAQHNNERNEDTARCTLARKGRFFSLLQKEDRTGQQRSVTTDKVGHGKDPTGAFVAGRMQKDNY